MSCLALRSDSKLCRNYARLELEGDCLVRGFTCQQHKDAFKDPVAVKRTWISNNRFFQNTVGIGRFLEYDINCRYHIEESLRLGLVTITKEDIRSIRFTDREAAESWTAFLVLVARYTPEFNIYWDNALSFRCIPRLWRLVQAYGPMEFTVNDIQLFLCSKTNPFSFYTTLSMYPIADPDVGYRPEDFYKLFDSCIQNHHEWAEWFVLEPMELIKDILEKLKPVKRETNATRLLFSEGFLAWRQEKKAEWYARRKVRSELFKEELIAMTWHPDRFQNWCLDWKEKEEMFDRWE